MKNKFFTLLFFCLILLIFAGCNAGLSVTRTEINLLGTFVTVRIDGMSEKSADRALDAAFKRLNEIEQIASAKKADSELSYVNNNAYEQSVTVSEELFFLLENGLYYSRLTNGGFDITLGSIVELWGIGTNNARVPDLSEIAEAVENSGFEFLLLDKAELSVRFLKPGLKIDLGAIAKGYAADEMKRVLIEHNVKNALLNLGGDIITIGDNNGKGWLIGLSDPFNPDTGKYCARLRIFNQTIVTSGNYERYFIHENTRYHHIFDRNTGFPAENRLVSATIISDVSMSADALSTALFVNPALISEFPEIKYILIDSDMNFTYSEGLELEIFK